MNSQETQALIQGAGWPWILRALYLTVKVRSTGVTVISCPFHTERTPSLHCWPESKRFFCHGCWLQGDMIEFIKWFSGWDDERVIELLQNAHQWNDHPDQALLDLEC